MPKNTLRLIQVGFGGSGRTWYTNVYPEFPQVEVVACVDANAQRRQQLQAELSPRPPRWFASLQEALGSVDADAVMIATQVEGHVPLAREALQSGKHVLVEKPFARRAEEAAEIADLADERGLRVVVGQNYRFFPAARTVQRLMSTGELGSVASIRVDFRHDVGLTRTAETKHAQLEHPLLLDMAIHHFDLLRMFLDADPREVICHTYNPPWSEYRDPPAAFATIRFPGDVVVSYRGSWTSHNERTPWTGLWEMEFENGSVIWQGRLSALDTSADRVFVRRYDGPDREIPLLDVPHIDRAGALEVFLRSIETGKEAECSARNNVGTVAFVNAMIESARTGRIVSVS